ncbi:hypothetical protein DO71_5858 [Burkholderia pseudomallei]|nr:hypothetical protein DO71_5858 [Burkholderia pseudomallei]KGW44136.1 hypothetical protein Y597_6117 [Burkholderia pseudomallei MSHR1000]
MRTGCATRCCRAELQRIAVGFQRTDALLELNDIARRRQIGFTALAFRGFKPVAQLFDDVGKHVGSPRKVRSPGESMSGISRIGLTRL